MKNGLYICERIEENIAVFESVDGDAGFEIRRSEFPEVLSEGDFFKIEFSSSGDVVLVERDKGAKEEARLRNRRKLESLFDN